MSVNKRDAMASRRGFLKSAAVAGSAAAVSTMATGAAKAAVPAGASTKQERQGAGGYHVTPHILDYYEKARF